MKTHLGHNKLICVKTVDVPGNFISGHIYYLKNHIHTNNQSFEYLTWEMVDELGKTVTVSFEDRKRIFKCFDLTNAIAEEEKIIEEAKKNIERLKSINYDTPITGSLWKELRETSARTNIHFLIEKLFAPVDNVLIKNGANEVVVKKDTIEISIPLSNSSVISIHNTMKPVQVPTYKLPLAIEAYSDIARLLKSDFKRGYELAILRATGEKANFINKIKYRNKSWTNPEYWNEKVQQATIEYKEKFQSQMDEFKNYQATLENMEDLVKILNPLLDALVIKYR